MNWIKKLLGIKPNQDEFADIAKKALQKYSGIKQIDYDKKNFSLNAQFGTDDSENMVYFLANAFEEYCIASRDQREIVLQAYYGPTPHEIPNSLDEALPNLLPRVHTRAFFEGNALQYRTGEINQTTNKNMDCPYITVAEHFGKTVVFDTPTTLLHMYRDNLSQWNAQLEDVLKMAMQNLSDLTPEPFEEIAPGLFMSQYQDSHDATRILLLDRIKECKIQGRPLVMVPNRNTMILTGESDHTNHSLMLNVVEEALKQLRPMLAFPIVLSDQTWHLWHPVAHHEEIERFKYLSAIGMDYIYDTQKTLLDKIHEKEGTDIFVANFLAFKKKDTGEIRSMTVWTEGVHAYLPKVDCVSFVRVEEKESNGVLATVAWEAAQQIVGSLMKPMGIYPERYEVVSFPDEKQMAELVKFSE